MANNVCVYIGRSGGDPVDRTTSNGTQVVIFNLAVDRIGSAQKKTDWFEVRAYGKLAERVLSYVKKGKKYAVSGSTHIDTWEKNGVYRSSAYVKMKDFQMLDKKPKTDREETPERYDF